MHSTEELDTPSMVLSMLNKIGPTNRSELAGLVSGASLDMVNELVRTKHARIHFGDVDVVAITKHGAKSIGVVSEYVHAPKFTRTEDDGYHGEELRPYTGRPNCNDAMALPSRYFNQLHYRDGRVAEIA